MIIQMELMAMAYNSLHDISVKAAPLFPHRIVHINNLVGGIKIAQDDFSKENCFQDTYLPNIT